MKNNLRMTPQTLTVIDIVNKEGHASNSQILQIAKSDFPNLSATTIHRITTRLIAAGLLASGPQLNGVKLIDSNLQEHDHFVCSACGGIKDVTITPKLHKDLQQQTGSTIMPSSLVVIGDCQNCPKIKP